MCEGCRAGPSPKMDRRNFLKLGGVGLAGAVLLGTAGGRVLAQGGPSLGEAFRSAAAEYGVPVELLLAMGYTNTYWEMPPPTATDYDPDDPHGHGTHGVMQLYQNPSRNTLGRAADLTQFSEQELKSDRAANVRGGAAVLADMAGAPKPDTLSSWREAVAEYGGVDFYALEVFQTLESGAQATISTGESLRLAPQDVDIPTVTTSRAANTDYKKAEWHGAHKDNYSARFERERDVNIDSLVIHVVEGPVASAINTFQNPSEAKSAHYIVGDEGRVVQCVRHEDVAWHAGDWPTNRRSIGIEHGGWASEPETWTREKVRASARLAAYCCRRHKIRVDAKHIILHRNVPGVTKTCPGPHFPYERYLKLVRSYK